MRGPGTSASWRWVKARLGHLERNNLLLRFWVRDLVRERARLKRSNEELVRALARARGLDTTNHN